MQIEKTGADTICKIDYKSVNISTQVVPKSNKLSQIRQVVPKFGRLSRAVSCPAFLVP